MIPMLCAVEVHPMEEKLGKVRISSQVLATIARLTTLSVPGVVSMFHGFPGGVKCFLKGKRASDGVHIEVVDDAVAVELAITVAADVNIYEVGREIQSRVARAIKTTVGMPVVAVNVHVEDVDRVPPAEA
jgi:uncharacterized alkaline shock family protein YloU